MQKKYRVAGYVKLAKKWEKREKQAIVFPPCLYCFAVSYCSFIIPGKGNRFNKQLDRIVGFLGIQLPKSIFISS